MKTETVAQVRRCDHCAHCRPWYLHPGDPTIWCSCGANINEVDGLRIRPDFSCRCWEPKP